jgi:S-(hydroxymethyl)glutathione dehydrogenase/alcohol dehydrogenase
MPHLKMKAAILEKLNAPLVVDEVEVPDLECGQVLIQVHRSGICGAQIGEIAGVKGEDKYLPHLLGHEGGGVVVDFGPGVTHIQRGDHVVMHWRKGLGIESRPPKYRRDSGVVGAGWVTTFNEYAVVSENRVTPIQKDIPFDIAALMGCAVTTAFGLINNEAQVKIGQSVAVIGCGGVGLNVVQGAAMVSANPIIAIDIYDHKLKMAMEFGATHLINSTQTDIQDEIQKIVGPKGVDVFIECTGQVQLIEKAYELTAAKGRTIMVGQPRHDQNLTIRSMLKHFSGKLLTDSAGGQTNPTEDIPRYLNLYRQGTLKLDNLITHWYPLAQINTALDIIRNGEAGRCMLRLT